MPTPRPARYSHKADLQTLAHRSRQMPTPRPARYSHQADLQTLATQPCRAQGVNTFTKMLGRPSMAEIWATAQEAHADGLRRFERLAKAAEDQPRTNGWQQTGGGLSC
eukprot:7350587-Alexandrium_andersonii.AAC.1